MSSSLIVSNRLTPHTQYFQDPYELESYLEKNDISKILFVFWSFKVSKVILERYKCYGMHTGPLLEGKGRGGDPIGNLKRLGVKLTTVCAFEMTEKIDAGKVKIAIPIYIDGTKEEIIKTIDSRVPEIAEYLFTDQPEIPELFTRADVKQTR